MKKAWHELPRDSAALFNPALLSILIERAVRGALQEGQDGLSWELSYLVTPMSLDSETRNSLPRRINSPFVSWIAKNPEVRSILPRKITSMSAYVREALYFGLNAGLFLVEKHFLTLGKNAPPKRLEAGTDEVQMLHKAAFFLGRWLSTYPNKAELYSLLGVQP